LNKLKAVGVYTNRKELYNPFFLGKTDKETEDDKLRTKRGCSADLSALFYRIKNSVDAHA
jgi:hypothetical protein